MIKHYWIMNKFDFNKFVVNFLIQVLTNIKKLVCSKHQVGLKNIYNLHLCETTARDGATWCWT